MLDLSNPFPGLRCFLSEEDYLFFGRHEQIEDLLRRLRTNRLVAVVGTSGSGKSSLVRAGLLPAVLGGGMAQAGSAWDIAVMRPGGSPMAIWPAPCARPGFTTPMPKTPCSTCTPR
jgi:ABC-type nitrate/sulfonate/bicarbonate transport system, ATPase component